MPARPPVLPDADDFPEIETEDWEGTSIAEDVASDLSLRGSSDAPLTAETEVAHSLDDMAVEDFEDAPEGEAPLDFDDGGEMGRSEA